MSRGVNDPESKRTGTAELKTVTVITASSKLFGTQQFVHLFVSSD